MTPTEKVALTVAAFFVLLALILLWASRTTSQHRQGEHDDLH